MSEHLDSQKLKVIAARESWELGRDGSLHVPKQVCDEVVEALAAAEDRIEELEEDKETINAIGIELNPDYAEMAWTRIQDLAETRRIGTFAEVEP